MVKDLWFLYVGGPRPWKLLEGLDDGPGGEVWELRSVPGNVVAMGGSEAEVVENMRKALEAWFKHVGSPEAWYEKAWRVMSAPDRQKLGEHLLEMFRSRRDLRAIDGFRYDIVPASHETAEAC